MFSQIYFIPNGPFTQPSTHIQLFELLDLVIFYKALKPAPQTV